MDLFAHCHPAWHYSLLPVPLRYASSGNRDHLLLSHEAYQKLGGELGVCSSNTNSFSNICGRIERMHSGNDRGKLADRLARCNRVISRIRES